MHKHIPHRTRDIGETPKKELRRANDMLRSGTTPHGSQGGAGDHIPHSAGYDNHVYHARHDPGSNVRAYVPRAQEETATHRSTPRPMPQRVQRAEQGRHDAEYDPMGNNQRLVDQAWAEFRDSQSMGQAQADQAAEYDPMGLNEIVLEQAWAEYSEDQSMLSGTDPGAEMQDQVDTDLGEIVGGMYGGPF